MPSRVRVEQKLVRVKAMPLLRRVGAVHAVAVECPGPDPSDVTVPDLVRVLGKADARRLALARLVEQAYLDLARMRREQRKIDAFAVPGRAQRPWQAFPGHNLEIG